MMARYSRSNLSRLTNVRFRERRTPIGQSNIIGRIDLLLADFLDARSMVERGVMGFAPLNPSYAGWP
jgi:hypothetical protein